ncbi:efflux transporter outer membrane subunit [Paraherbaspirillum soli]|uniref:Efflux transporter outer membrane subunit n=1 Tax=Paraherbaspirillum soli TaxID=631222 RepID=A0ABW0MA26_9BURK
MKTFNLSLTTLVAALVLAGCSTTKPPEQVAVDLPSQYRESAPALDGAWKVATPADQVDRGNWWSVFGDAQLSNLIADATQASPTLVMAMARVKESRATAGLADADRAFQLGAGIGPTRQGNAAGASTQWRAQLNASYEVDLFGRLSDSSRAARLDVQGQEAAYRSVLLALQADVAQQYFAIRSLDSELDVLQQTIKLRQDALHLVQRRYDAGDTSELDVAQAKTELSVTQAELEGVQRNRSQRDHALAILLGKTPAQFTLAATPLQPVTVSVPAGLPSDLLERRPDIAQAQRQLAAASARIGVAKAAFFPSLVLTGSAGYESNALHNLFQWSSRSWLLGPLVGTVLNLPLLDGGRNKANLAKADANYEALVANYRQQVLVGFQDVEDNLSALRTLDNQIRFQDEAVSSAQLAARLADSRYRNGSASYFEVIDAQRSSLSAQRAKSQSVGQRAVASVGLIRALGGGWGEGSATPAAKEARS